MKVFHNTPAAGYIAWEDVNIAYKGEIYSPPDGHTHHTYVWWELSDPDVLKASATYPDLGDDDLLVFYNKSGTYLIIPFTTVLDGSLIVPDSIVTEALAANAVTTEKLATNSVTADQIAANAIGTAALAAGAVIADKIAAGEITSTHIGANTVITHSANIEAAVIDTAHIDKIAASKIIGDKLHSTNWGSNAGTELDLDAGTAKFGGSASPALEWDGTTLSLNGTPAGTIEQNAEDGKDAHDMFEDLETQANTAATKDGIVTREQDGEEWIPRVHMGKVGDRPFKGGTVQSITGMEFGLWANKEGGLFLEGQQRAVTFVVAASDAKPDSKAQADFVCDGTDDQDEINAALTATRDEAGGGLVQLTEGTFHISDTVNLLGDVGLRGQGIHTILRRVDDSDEFSILKSYTYGTPVYNIYVIRNLVINDNASNQDAADNPELKRAIHLESYVAAYIENVFIDDVQNMGMYLSGSAQGSNDQVTNCTVISEAKAIEIHGPRAIIENSRFISTGSDVAVLIEGIGVKFINNRVQTSSGTGIQAIYPAGVVVSNNIVSGCDTGIYFRGTTDTSFSGTCSGVIAHNTVVDTEWGDAISVRGVENILVDGNCIDGGDNYGVYIWGTAFGDRKPCNARVLNNIITGCSPGIGIASTGERVIIGNNTVYDCFRGIHMGTNSKGAIIEGNNVAWNSWEGIYLYRSTSNLIQGNSIEYNGRHGLRMYYNSSMNTIVGNRFVGNSQSADQTYHHIYAERYGSSSSGACQDTSVTNNFFNRGEESNRAKAGFYNDGYYNFRALVSHNTFREAVAFWDDITCSHSNIETGAGNYRDGNWTTNYDSYWSP